MNILYDENIPCGHAAFGTLGAVRSCAGRSITAAMVKNVDLLFVRSVTTINEALLAGSRVKFVATATSGSDHVDKAYLAKRGITCVDAIGSNANSVAEYVVAALLTLAARRSFTLAGMTIGVVGVGHVGSLVVEKARALGMHVLQNDPPRQRAEPGFPGVPLAQALDADVVTFHVPLTLDGPDATRHLINERTVAQMKQGAILVQTCRGEVHDTAAVLRALAKSHLGAAVIDVWEHEPCVELDLLDAAALATPHIAGYSWISKVRATHIIYEAACRFLNHRPAWVPPTMPTGITAPEIPLPGAHVAVEAIVRTAVRGVYDIEVDDARMRAVCMVADGHRGVQFDELRKQYPTRLEFPQVRLKEVPPSAASMLRGVGFSLPA